MDPQSTTKPGKGDLKRSHNFYEGSLGCDQRNTSSTCSANGMNLEPGENEDSGDGQSKSKTRDTSDDGRTLNLLPVYDENGNGSAFSSNLQSNLQGMDENENGDGNESPNPRSQSSPRLDRQTIT